MEESLLLALVIGIVQAASAEEYDQALEDAFYLTAALVPVPSPPRLSIRAALGGPVYVADLPAHVFPRLFRFSRDEFPHLVRAYRIPGTCLYVSSWKGIGGWGRGRRCVFARAHVVGPLSRPKLPNRSHHLSHPPPALAAHMVSPTLSDCCALELDIVVGEDRGVMPSWDALGALLRRLA